MREWPVQLFACQSGFLMDFKLGKQFIKSLFKSTIRSKDYDKPKGTRPNILNAPQKGTSILQ